MNVAPSLQDRCRGALLGGAAGDALGAPVEFERDPARLSIALDEGVLTTLPDPAITDDTQLTAFTAEALLQTWVRSATYGIADMDGAMHRAYLRWLATQTEPAPRTGMVGIATDPRLWSRRAPGNTCLSALASGHAGSVAHRINDSMSCGGVMRVAPIGLVLRPDEAFERGCANAAITHGHDNGIAPAGALAMLVSLVVAGRDLDDAITTCLERLDGCDYGAPTARILRTAVEVGGATITGTVLTDALGEGWVGHEALAIAVACVVGLDDAAASVRAASDHRGDSDSTASIAGQLLGAARGVQAFPASWTRDVELADLLTRLADALASIGDRTADPDRMLLEFPGY